MEYRLAFNDCVVVGEGVERLNEELAIARFHVNVAQCAQRHSAARVEPVEHALSLGVGDEFLLEGPKHFRIDRFKLESDLIRRAAATLEAIIPLAAQPM